MKKILIIFTILLLAILVIYKLPVAEKDFAQLYDGEEEIKASLLKFREIPGKSVEVNGVEWPYLVYGNGDKNLLFLHGLAGAYDIWWQQLTAMKDSFRMITLSYPAVHTLEEKGQAIMEILKREGIDKVNVVGSSLGGYIAQYLLSRYPEKIEKIVLGNTFPPNDIYKEENATLRKWLPLLPEWLIMKQFRKNLKLNVTPFSENSPLVEAYLLEQYFGHMRKAQLLGRFDCVLQKFEPARTEIHKNIPKLIIESDNDPLVKPFLQQGLKELYPETAVFTFKGKGHFPYLNDPVVYTEQLKAFLKK